MNTGYSNNSTPSLNGLIDISADTITTSTVSTDTIVLNGTDITASLSQVPINTSNITTLQQITTGITYSDAGSIDLTTIDNNLTITNTKKIKCATAPTTNEDIVNKLYCDTAIANLVNSAPASLDTLNELASAMGDDANFSTTVINSLATKATLPILSPTGNDNLTLTTTGNNNIILNTPGSTGGLYFQTQGQNRLFIAGGGTSIFYNQIEFDSGNDAQRKIYNTYYFLMDTDTTAGGIERGRIYSNASYVFLELYTGHKFMITIGGTNVYEIDLTKATFLNPPVCSTNCTTSSQLANKAYVDSVIPSITNLVDKTTAQAISGIKTFNDVPVCSITATTANQLINKSYCDNASSNSPVGTIIMYGSNTIPPGWLLCNGSNVSKTAYVDLWNVIGDTFLTFPPPTGFFQLPSFVGLYPRGAGYNAGLTSVSTTLGQVMTGQVGRHGHISASMNSDTQGTTTSKSVVSAVSGLAGLVISSTSVSAPVITTTATNGTTITTLDTYNPLNSILTAETRPNNISVNYIIKFQTSATPTPLPTPTFTQTTSVLTIQNNAPSSGIINFVLDNASSVLQTPLSLSSTDITVSLPVSCASTPTIGNHLVNKTYVDGLVAGGVGLTSTDQTITGVKTFSNNLITNADVFGRNDGNAFNTYTSFGTYNLYPIGYCWEILGSLSTPTNGSNYAGIIASINLTNGVWAISGYMVINKGTGAYTATSNVSVLWDTVTGIRIYPASSGMIFPLIQANTAAKYVIPLGTINVVVTTAGAIQTITRKIVCTVGSLTWQVSFTGVKIA